MPLPIPNSDWPPEPFNNVYQTLREWSAWYAGDPQELVSTYKNSSQTASRYQSAGGLIGWIARLFWGTPPSKGVAQTSKLHLPLAEDIAMEGAKQLFKNPPRITVTDTKQQARIEDYIDDGLFYQLLEAAELANALADVYIRVGYDLDVSDKPLRSIHPADLVIPFFRYNKLQSVLIWREILNDSGRIFRHFELHEIGWVQHRLYEGSSTNIGKAVSLNTFPETAGLKEAESTGLDELAVIHFPNLRTRLWRKLGPASNLGRSDFGAPGTITLMDALDETYTSLMRDIRLGKYRLMVPQQYLDTQGRGEGAVFDADKEVFVELNVMGGSDKLEIIPSQAQIRVTDHVEAATQLTQEIVSKSGYSAQTFGLTGEVAMTATESNARERKTFDTRAIKIEGVWQPRTQDLIRLMQKVDVIMGNSFGVSDDTLVEFPPPVEANLKEKAETVEILNRARAIAIDTSIRYLHPDWNDERVGAEVSAIQGTVIQS